jgi:hypothetical protein
MYFYTGLNHFQKHNHSLCLIAFSHKKKLPSLFGGRCDNPNYPSDHCLDMVHMNDILQTMHGAPPIKPTLTQNGPPVAGHFAALSWRLSVRIWRRARGVALSLCYFDGATFRRGSSFGLI